MITENDIAVLKALSIYYVLTRAQIQGLCNGHHSQGRSTRKRLAKLVDARYVNKHRTLIPYGTSDNGCPIYYLSELGAELLAAYFDDPKYLHAVSRRPRADLLFHWVAISETHTRIDAAVDRESDVAIAIWANEWEVVNKGAAESAHYVLHTVLREAPNPLSCSPDAGFLLDCRGYKRVIYLEQDRGTSSVNQIAAAKTPGYMELHRRAHHRKHFPETSYDDFTVLMITTNPGRRNQLAKAIQGKEGDQLWLFVAQDELTPETLLYEPIYRNVKGEAVALLRRAVDG